MYYLRLTRDKGIVQLLIGHSYIVFAVHKCIPGPVSPPVTVLNDTPSDGGPTPADVRARTVTLYAVLGTRLEALKGERLRRREIDTPTSRFSMTST